MEPDIIYRPWVAYAFSRWAVSLDKVMTKEDQRRTGVSKLTAEEKTALEEWLSRFALDAAAAVSKMSGIYSGVGQRHWIKEIVALRSRRGASFRLLQKLGSPHFQPIISPPLCLEYEDVFRRPDLLPGYTDQDIGDFLDSFLSECIECRIHFLWRPHLPDPKDDLVLELALAGNAPFIITHNQRDFQGVDGLGIQAVTPDDFLSMLPK